MLEIKNLNKSFGDNHILKDVSLEVEKGKALTIIGPSGAGKSTLLRCINFLTLADSGSITLDGQSCTFPVDDKTIHEIRKNTAMIFQNYNLFNNKTALENIQEPMIIRDLPKKQIEETSRNLLSRVGLSEKANSYPHQLSGGQQQRIGIARALAVNPKILLFDEPTSALDPELITEVIDTIIDLTKEDYTMLIVTHDMRLAQASDEIIFMEDGYIIERRTAETLMEKHGGRIEQFLSSINAHQD